MKLRKTLTNIKKIDRLKATVIFALLQVIIIGLFSFALVKSVPVKVDNISFSEGRIENYRFAVRPSHRRGWNYLLICEMQGIEYKIHVSASEKDKIEDVLQTYTIFKVGTVNGEVVSYSFDGVEEYSINDFHKVQRSERIFAIVLLCIIEIALVPLFILFIVYHRTSKDPIIKRKKNNDEEKS